MRGATAEVPVAGLDDLFQSTLPMRGATILDGLTEAATKISIHTPHAGSDGIPRVFINTGLISIHTPHAGSDAI